VPGTELIWATKLGCIDTQTEKWIVHSPIMSQPENSVNGFQKLRDLPFALKMALGGCIVLSALELFVLFQQFAGLKIDSGVATLFGAILGLGIVGWQTSRGFQNLIRSQENQSRIEREARLHRAELEQAAEARTEEKQRSALLGALRAEIAYLFGAVTDAAGHVHVIIAIEKALIQRGRPSSTKAITLHSFEAPVFNANISALGLIGAYLGADIIKVLSRANGKEVKITQDEPMPHDVVLMLYEGNLSSLRKWASDLHHVALRILSYENGTHDPGTLSVTEQSRYAELKVDET